MKKIDIGKQFKTNRFKYGSYSTVITIFVLAILLAVNFAAGKFNIKKDLTKDKLYSLTEQSQKILGDLKNDTKIYAFFEAGKEDPNFKAVLDQYKSASKKISVEYADPTKNPTLAEKYKQGDVSVGVGTIVVERSNKFKTISYDSFFNYTYDETGQSKLDSFAAEQQITNAIVYVNSDKQQVLYTLTGHEEKTLGSDITNQLEAENYNVQDINLLQGNAVLNKDNILVVVSPARDLSKDEAVKIKTFLGSGGRAAFLMDVTQNNLPNFQDIFSAYGVKLQNALIIEGQADKVANSPIYLLPNIMPQDIVSSIKSSNLHIFMPLSQGIEDLKLNNDALTVEPLLTSSNNSWGKVNLQSTTMSKEANDLKGPFNIAVAITNEDKTNNTTSKLVVVGNSSFTSSDAISATNGANLDFIMNSFNWLQDKKDSVSIRPKSLTAANLMINGFQRLALSGVVVIVIPVVILVIGITVWLRRRYR